MKIKRLLCLILCAMFIFSGAVNALADPAESTAEESTAVPESNSESPVESLDNLSVQGGSHSIDGQSPVLGTGQLIKNAASVLLYETKTETLMYSWNADAKLFPASLVKIMTAMLVLDKGNLSEEVVVSEEALNSVDSGAVSADLQSGEIMSVENLLYCMMVDSANDAAAVLAEYISGSQSAFVEEMNAYAQKLGCTGTHFENAHGLHNDKQVTTARDVGRILAEAIKNETFRTIFGTVTYTIPATNKSESRKLETGNFLMNPNSMDIYYDSRVTGGRTGVSSDGKRCIAATAEKEGLSFISVIMGAASEYEEDGNKVKSFGGFPETTALLNRGCEGFRFGQIIYANQAIKQFAVSNGTSDVIVCPDVSVSTVLPRNADLNTLSYRFQENTGALTAPISKGDLIGSVEIWNDGICIGQSNIYAMNQVKVQKNSDQAETNSKQAPGNIKILCMAIGIVGGVVLFLLIIRSAGRHRKKVKRRRYSESRRRSR